MAREKERDLIGDVLTLELGLLLHDGHAGLEIGRLQVGHDSPGEPGDEPLLDRDHLVRGTITREHDLPVGIVERVERVEEFLLGALLARQELHVVQQQDVGRAIPTLELQRGGVLDGVDHLVHELLGAHEENPRARARGSDHVPDGVHEVCLAQSHAAVQEEGVVALARIRRDRLSDRVGELVSVPDDEGLEGVVRAQIAFVPGGQGTARALLEHRRLLRPHVKRQRDRIPRHALERGLDEPAVVMVQPVDVELARHLQHHRLTVVFHRPQRAEPRLERLTRNVRLDLLESALPHVTSHRRFHHRCHSVPHHTQGFHRLSTELSTKESGRNGDRARPLRPENGVSG